MTTGALRVALVDDHAVVRAGYRRLLELENIEVAAEFADADGAYAALSPDSADALDLLVLDLSLPGSSGLELLRRLQQRRPQLRVLVFTMHDSVTLILQCLKAGAVGFITKSSAPEVLVDAVQRAVRGERPLSPDVAAAVEREEALAQPEAPHLRLSTREFDVLRALIEGAGVEEISRRLHLSPKTVSNYQTLVRQKLGVSTAVELLRYAREHGLT
jgi:DNA-binding NarL/FixJ family response regulator